MKKNEKPLEEHIQFRIPTNTYKLLYQYAMDHHITTPGTNIISANMAARKIIENTFIPVNQDIQKISLTNLHNTLNITNRKLEYFIELFVFYLYNHFASHKKVPPDQAEAVAHDAEQRQQEFIEMFNNEVWRKHGKLMETMFADSFEEKPAKKL
jgi:hypothetical protein